MMVRVVVGDIFESRAQTLVNTVNTVGVMGKGIALGFRQRFPDMYADYVERCERQEVRLGEPYIYKRAIPPWIINFPTKEHWRSTARVADIVQGLRYLQAHTREWGVTSLGVPPLGCGEGQLEWRVVGPLLFTHLRLLNIPVELYAPYGTHEAELSTDFLSTMPSASYRERIKAAWVALVEILARIERQPYHWPVGSTTFQKIAYFATELGLPTGIDFARGSFGPFARQLKELKARLVNHGLLDETKLGNLFRLRPGDSHFHAREAYKHELLEYEEIIRKVIDLFLRLTPREAEVAATVHFVWKKLATSGVPSESAILKGVQAWKARRRPALSDEEIGLMIRSLNTLGLIRARYDAELPLPDRAIA